ncbi:hypothetical protein ACHAW6_004926 [Cyclotella cf. meneghiniana]
MNNSNDFDFGYDDDNDRDDDEMLNDIEAEIDADLHNDEMDVLTSVMTDTALSSSTVAPSGNSYARSTLPAHQVNHAAEFWFPECRECDCCRGFKHGCSCGGLCVCSAKGNHGASLLSDAISLVPCGDKSNEEMGSSKTPCKFYKLGNCRFGDSCRFSHS